MGDWGNFGKRKAEGEGRLDIGDWILGIGYWILGRRGGWPCYAPNPLRGACFAKASQPEGAEDMSKGARGGRGYGWVDFIRELR